ncbi:hypothetical protein D3C71_1080430 [compost metagenome]
MQQSNIKETIKRIKGFDDRKFKGLFSIYTHFFNILDKGTEKTDKLIIELKSELSATGCEKLSLTTVDLVFVKALVSGLLGKEAPESIKSYVHLLGMLKWFYRNNRKVLQESELYDTLSKSSRNTVVMESEMHTHEKLRLVLKSIDSDPKLMETIVEKASLLPSYKEVIALLWGTLRNVKVGERRCSLIRLFKSEEACCVVQTLFDKFISIDVFDNFRTTVDSSKIVEMFGVLVVGFTEEVSQ